MRESIEFGGPYKFMHLWINKSDFKESLPNAISHLLIPIHINFLIFFSAGGEDLWELYF